ncbi:hypothetical protein [Bosea thiooxidans]|uniref:hypothetical protein n=1 Tax=Bosea thiooxidans TaxID=53254 RepID=UPI001116B589|nr:hypothetical protein [Bosea thiooxidans]
MRFVERAAKRQANSAQDVGFCPAASKGRGAADLPRRHGAGAGAAQSCVIGGRNRLIRLAFAAFSWQCSRDSVSGSPTKGRHS